MAGSKMGCGNSGRCVPQIKAGTGRVPSSKGKKY